MKFSPCLLALFIPSVAGAYIRAVEPSNNDIDTLDDRALEELETVNPSSNFTDDTGIEFTIEETDTMMTEDGDYYDEEESGDDGDYYTSKKSKKFKAVKYLTDKADKSGYNSDYYTSKKSKDVKAVKYLKDKADKSGYYSNYLEAKKDTKKHYYAQKPLKGRVPDFLETKKETTKLAKANGGDYYAAKKTAKAKVVGPILEAGKELKSEKVAKAKASKIFGGYSATKKKVAKTYAENYKKVDKSKSAKVKLTKSISSAVADDDDEGTE